jgi:hypothetical protein
MSSLAGLGKAGLWLVDIDNEDPGGQEYEWSVTIRHPLCYAQSVLASLDTIQELADYLKCANPTSPFRLGATTEFELLVSLIDGHLRLHMGRIRNPTTHSFPWMLECTLAAEEAGNLAEALEEALNEAQPHDPA